MKKLLILLIIPAVLFSCNSEPKVEKVELVDGDMNTHTVVGNWSMTNILFEGEDVSKTQVPNGKFTIEFNGNQTYSSVGNPTGSTTGKWYWKAATSELFMDSDAGETSDSFWIVGFAKNKMQWKGSRMESSLGREINFKSIQ